MGFRFWRRIQIFPGLTLNISKSEISFSLGFRGFKYTFGRGERLTVGLPGTGLSYTKHHSGNSSSEESPSESQANARPKKIRKKSEDEE